MIGGRDEKNQVLSSVELYRNTMFVSCEDDQVLDKSTKDTHIKSYDDKEIVPAMPCPRASAEAVER